MKFAMIAAVALGAVLPSAAAAQTYADPYGIGAEIAAYGGPLAPCLTAIWSREDPWGPPHQQNLAGSGAEGAFQIMPSTWSSTAAGRRIAQAVASVADQIAVATELITGGWLSAWTPIPAGC